MILKASLSQTDKAGGEGKVLNDRLTIIAQGKLEVLEVLEASLSALDSKE